MKPYARKGRKLRINNRKKFNAGSRKIAWEFSPRNYPPKIAPLSLALKRYAKAKAQGLSKDEMGAYYDAML